MSLILDSTVTQQQVLGKTTVKSETRVYLDQDNTQNCRDWDHIV